ncbi:hypothetical protein BDV34DRAFT_192740 [Aspergillus parasiticus]|uniref:Uncharacterized protein n=1 Tax=Aspergillus parasiticus TaxID=5067 RepID=A0A5N6DPM9_ASPPA|nr:hypothetical protein BDV34DRAFT_192740 [Aspergillus parasiticus]
MPIYARSGRVGLGREKTLSGAPPAVVFSACFLFELTPATYRQLLHTQHPILVPYRLH